MPGQKQRAVIISAAFQMAVSACGDGGPTAIEATPVPVEEMAGLKEAIASGDAAIDDMIRRILPNMPSSASNAAITAKVMRLSLHLSRGQVAEAGALRLDLLRDIEVLTERAALAERIDLDVVRLSIESLGSTAQ